MSKPPSFSSSRDSDLPDVSGLLLTLKPFQLRTVDYAFRRMFLDDDPAYRFLVADEVGLGKTMVARGLIAKTIEHLWNDVERIDVVYVCSNVAIAKQNIRKLVPGVGHEQSLATRLTLLPSQMCDLGANKLNFVSLTPATSFSSHGGFGASQERVVLYALLKDVFGESAALKALLRGNIRSKERWEGYISREISLDNTLQNRFLKRLRQEKALKHEVESLLEELGWRERLSTSERKRRRELVSALRQFLAAVCVDALEPDLVILDEFQRFKHLLASDVGDSDDDNYHDRAAKNEHHSSISETNEAAALAQHMFKYVAPEGHRTRVLLLSATPYKMYSTDGEVGADDHYPDFLATTQFLMDDDTARLRTFEENLRRYRVAMVDALAGDSNELLASKAEVEGDLRKVMVRTERVGATVDRQSMIDEPESNVEVHANDVRQYLAVDALAQAVDQPEPVEFWKSAPYLSSFMASYQMSRRLDREIETDVVQRAFAEHESAHFRRETLHRYEEVDPANGRLRRLMADMLDNDAHDLLWVPPSLPYWPLEGPFKKHDVSKGGYSKALVFSAWKVVPDVVSALVSYEAERRALMGRGLHYEHLSNQVSRRLEFKVSNERVAGMPVLALVYPSAVLAKAINPVCLVDAVGNEDVREVVAARMGPLLSRLKPLEEAEGSTDERWYWAAPLLLDATSAPGREEKTLSFLQIDNWRNEATDEAGPTRLVDHLEVARQAVRGELHPPLGRMPEDLSNVLADLALGGPGVCALRASRWTEVHLEARQQSALLVADGLRSLFNGPTAIATVDRLYGEPYWRGVLKYAVAGNLQALLDEYLHQVWEQGGWSRLGGESGLEGAMREMREALTLINSSTQARPLVEEEGGFRLGRMKMRTDFARRYGRQRSDDAQQVATEVAVRSAFNSPFRPFVLVSTSVGQEGLDFHPWCHVVYHWNLPGNPVDLEQREGRVHRYKGFAVRRNLAARYGAQLRSGVARDEDVWERLFAVAERDRADGQSELVPHWLFEGPHCVERRVPVLPYSKEVERLVRLRRELAAYRLVFGQPRQQELLELLKGAELSEEAMAAWAIDLRPR